MQGRHDLTDAEWAIISPLPPDKPRGVPLVDDRRVISGIFHILRTGTPWRDLPERCGPHATICNRWARQGVWERLFEALAEKGGPDQAIGRSRGGLSTCTANATSSNVSSTSSSTSEASRPAITSLQETSSPQSPSPASASGSKSMSTRPGPDPHTSKVWYYDYRINVHHTLKQKPLTYANLAEFIACYNLENHHARRETWSEDTPDGRWCAYPREDLTSTRQGQP